MDALQVDLLRVERSIRMIRHDKVILDEDLAELYGVEVKRLNEQVRRNIDRFPADFMFQLTNQEFKDLKSQFATSSQWGGRRTSPYAFTEQGVAMLSSVLHSPQAVRVNIEIMRTFVRVRELAATHGDLAARLNELEDKTEALSMQHDAFAHNTRAQLKQVFEAIRQLMTPPDPPKRPIGFVTEDKACKSKGAKAKR